MQDPIKNLLKTLKLDAIVGIDFESYYDDDYSLRKMATTEYIVDPRFEMQMASVQWHTDKKPSVYNPTEFKQFCEHTNWKRTGMLAHHTHFDGLILSHHFKTKPAFYLDTLSMARLLMPIHVGGSLKKVTEAFGRPGKIHANALADVKGRHLKDFTKQELKALAVYAGDDIEDCWYIFRKMLPFVPVDELKLIDLTVKMYARPRLLIDKAMVEGIRDAEIKSKADLLSSLKVAKEQLMSSQQFAVLLEAAGATLPKKIKPKVLKNMCPTGGLSAVRDEDMTFAFSRQDLEFTALLKHRKKRVRDLVAARFAVKSTQMETRTNRMAQRAAIGPQPVYLNYCGAATTRWSGGDAMNWQNFTRGSDIRKSIHAPKGHTLVIADLAQIEARLNAWFAGQADIVQAFAKGDDVYALQATKIYGRPINKKDHPDERFVGKVATLALGYQAGAARFADMLRAGQFGPPVAITDALAESVVRAWRMANGRIVASWKSAQNHARSAFLGQQRIPDGVTTYEGTKKCGFLHLPNGTAIRYDGVECDEEGMFYLSKHYSLKKGGATLEHKRLYGGLVVENRTQALARVVVGEHMVAISAQLPKAPIVMFTHDEIVVCCANWRAERTLRDITHIMSTPPVWAMDLPLAVDAHISERYDK